MQVCFNAGMYVCMYLFSFWGLLALVHFLCGECGEGMVVTKKKGGCT